MNYGYGIIEGEERKMKGYEMRWGGCIKSRKERRKGTTAQYIYKKKKKGPQHKTRGDMLWLKKNQKYVVVGFRIREPHVGAIRLQFDQTNQIPFPSNSISSHCQSLCPPQSQYYWLILVLVPIHFVFWYTGGYSFFFLIYQVATHFNCP